MKTIRMPGGDEVAALGQGTWYLGDDPATHDREIAALREGLDQGMTLIDTAEMYGNGRAESLVGEAIAGRRDEAYLVSKVLPSNAGFEATIRACEASLSRLGTDCLDLYLLHWQGREPFGETVAAFERLQVDGKIRHYGVSNLDLAASQAFLDAGGRAMQANQLLYNLDQRGIEWDLLPWLDERGIVTMAYSPFDGGALLRHRELVDFATARDMTPAQVCLAWLASHKRVLPIPKSADPARVAENAEAMHWTLDAADLATLDSLFDPPTGPSALSIY
ncbi:aldo/keto reductase [Salinisphaera sp. Q1T1-3]|uniref:aldo/keto reductase n=1 Tax=Salinisphaera sp. Q1T1-3 TaxID=2321229 RepID=UPI000E7651FC|nr:aldo/keto reductase [Salinisphaera sp. Q1T1-3]RJS95072.1 aldo/keto reductase [Salinisphaera sp. Q1T1-3]